MKHPVKFVLTAISAAFCMSHRAWADAYVDEAKAVVANPLVKLILLGLIWLYMHHFCAGIRYLLLDLHKGVDLQSARFSSKVVFAVSIALTVIIGAKVLL